LWPRRFDAMQSPAHGRAPQRGNETLFDALYVRRERRSMQSRTHAVTPLRCEPTRLRPRITRSAL